MKILIVEYRDTEHPEAGGAEVILFEIYGRLVDQGHQVDYLCTQHADVPREDVMNGLNIVRRGYQPLFNFNAPRVYRRELASRGYDVIVEGIDKIPFFFPLMEKNVPVLCNIPHLFGESVFDQASFPVGAYVWLFERFIPAVYRNCHFQVLSESTRDDLIGRGVAAERLHVIHPGLDHGLYTAHAENQRNARPTVLYLGRIKKYKGIDIGMRAVRRLLERYPDIDYQVAGQGDYLDDLKRMARELGMEQNVSFVGQISGEAKVEVIRRSDVLLYASPKEGWGMSVVEANACGTPVVASNSPGLRDSIQDGATGYLVPHGDEAAVADRIDALLSNAEHYQAMRTAALQWAATFTWERATSRTLELIQEIREDAGQS